MISVNRIKNQNRYLKSKFCLKIKFPLFSRSSAALFCFVAPIILYYRSDFARRGRIRPIGGRRIRGPY